MTPLQALRVVASQPVDAFDAQQIARLQLLDQPPVLGPLEVLAGLLVQGRTIFYLFSVPPACQTGRNMVS